ncbi:zinc knuckle domain containing [Pyrenophora seminiperda CCB06]|uniref:Zinc knuckle domain containing n=1 Tax=Pyrenophora seminiperda CCB06 TaxID=1302712 RepID=A0A3M7LZA3_9PLEO|nr:zinc knuckle domain containing [Pyrenophora seminiperda CCB06]
MYSAPLTATLRPRPTPFRPSYCLRLYRSILTLNADIRGGPRIMSSLSRRACFKCGNVGHYAEVCSSSERLCYNCKTNMDPICMRAHTDLSLGKQPGHESNGCPHPRTTERMGRGAGAPRGGYGGGFRGGFAGGARPATCYKCGGPNHFARDCQAQAMKCYACGKLVDDLRARPKPSMSDIVAG